MVHLLILFLLLPKKQKASLSKTKRLTIHSLIILEIICPR